MSHAILKVHLGQPGSWPGIPYAFQFDVPEELKERIHEAAAHAMSKQDDSLDLSRIKQGWLKQRDHLSSLHRNAIPTSQMLNWIGASGWEFFSTSATADGPDFFEVYVFKKA
mmetsp:Transcript_2195/g.6205  ORF Transcript_2195/g.6205 Transcript_2195/m.6205 type:complete len:112 (-) Transcript_2195:146-481(-)